MHYQRKRTKGTLELPEKPSECSVAGCTDPPRSRGWCAKHYERWRQHGDPTATLRTPNSESPSVCIVRGCGRPHLAKGYCTLHYNRARRSEDVGEAAARRAPNGTGYINPAGYRVRTIKGKNVYEHRAVAEQKLGRAMTADETVHHINGQRADNRPENLEVWVSSHPAGQRIEDVVAHAEMILARYAPDKLS